MTKGDKLFYLMLFLLAAPCLLVALAAAAIGKLPTDTVYNGIRWYQATVILVFSGYAIIDLLTGD